jgi:integrase
MQSSVISSEGYALIRAVSGYSQKEGKRVNERRDQTRRGGKKERAVSISKEQAGALKAQPDSPQGRRDALLMCLLLDHGLRVSEVAGLSVENFDLSAGTFTFYRQKVDKTQTHTMTADTLRAAMRYLQQDATESGPLLRGSRKGGKLEGSMGIRRMTERVKVLGERIGLTGLSPHDCRHYWATAATRGGTHPFALQEAGGWNSLAMPRRYTEEAKIANEGVKLD